MAEGFSGTVKTEWNNNGRDMKLLESLSYTDPNGKVWNVPEGSFLNGATIPRSLWSTVGSPFTGNYRRASVIHDYFVGEGENPDVSPEHRKEADKMFYHACLFDGCSKAEAAILYIGVRVGTWSSVHLLSEMNNAISPISPSIAGIKIKKEFDRTYFKLEDDLAILDFDLLEQKVDAILTKPGISPLDASFGRLNSIV